MDERDLEALDASIAVAGTLTAAVLLSSPPLCNHPVQRFALRTCV
ncbi:hypothetical protein AB0929_34665 [Streptomyces massasporeus]